MWIKIFLFFSLILNPLGLSRVVLPAPHAVDGYEIIAAVNAFRANYGLAPYEIDGSLMSIAQSQSDYQASINTNTHTRPDGSGAEIVSSENIATGLPGQSVESIIHAQWLKDYPHTITLIGFTTGRAGAAVATGSDGILYYTLDVINTGGPLTNLTADSVVNVTPAGNGTPASYSVATSLPIGKLYTSTPASDGSVIHTVQYGQTLWGIANAYGISLTDLYTINRINPTQVVISIGQKLLIHPSSTPAPTVAATETPIPPTATLTASPTISPTATLTTTPTPKGFALALPKIKTTAPVRITLIILAVLSLIGVSLMVVSRLIKRK
ncbi:MAG: LysM peptidoglycan-binding domain-containing protein [Anaerolineae bacterium]|nr:LysM peptidoglycan-binding domain-containing protein [Anaerolineae bacterium]